MGDEQGMGSEQGMGDEQGMEVSKVWEMSKVWKVSKVWEMSKVWEVSSINENSQTFIKFWHFLKLIASKTLFKKSYRNVNQCSVFTFHVPRLVNIIHDFNFKDFQSPGYTHLNEWWQSYPLLATHNHSQNTLRVRL